MSWQACYLVFFHCNRIVATLEFITWSATNIKRWGYDNMNYGFKKVVITGGAGFIGSQLGYELYRQGFQVVLLDNLWAGYVDNLVIDGKTFGHFIAKDIRDSFLEKYLEGAEFVIHLAGIAALPVCQSEPQFAYDVNTSGTANVLEASRKVGVKRVLFSSTSAVYESNEEEILKESLTVCPNLVYASTKLAAERICKAYAMNYGMDIIITRFFNVYGPHQDFLRKSPPFTSYIAKELLAKRAPILFNRTSAKRDYVHSADVVQILLKMLHAEKHYSAEIFNVATGIGYSVPEIYEYMKDITKVDIEPFYKDPDSFWNSYDNLFIKPYMLSRGRITKEVYKNAVADVTKTEKEFSWKASYSIQEGLRTVCEYAKIISLH